MPKNKPAKKLPAKISARWKRAGKKQKAEDARWAEVDRKKAEAKALAKDKNEAHTTIIDNSDMRSVGIC